MHILLIARHYPPEASGGARRPFLYVQALRALGHRISLVTPFDQGDDPDAITVSHPANLEQSLGVEPEKQISAQAPKLARRVKDGLRAWLLWPEPDIRWARRVEIALSKLAQSPDWEKPDVMITTHPPESLHVIGARLSSKLGLPWLAEMRDTWIDMPHRNILARSKLRAALETRMARKCLSKASGITAVSEAVMAEGRRYKHPRAPELIIGHFSAPSQETLNLSLEQIHLVHAGGFTLSDRRRPLAPLLKVIAQAATARPNLHLHIAGRLSPEELSLIQGDHGFQITAHGLIPLARSRALQNAADGLILYTPPDSHALPGKFAEYRFAGRPIFFFGGGAWTKLVDDPSVLRALDTDLVSIKKGESITSQPPLDAEQAAQTLLHFLDSEILMG